MYIEKHLQKTKTFSYVKKVVILIFLEIREINVLTSFLEFLQAVFFALFSG